MPAATLLRRALAGALALFALAVLAGPAHAAPPSIGLATNPDLIFRYPVDRTIKNTAFITRQGQNAPGTATLFVCGPQDHTGGCWPDYPRQVGSPVPIVSGVATLPTITPTANGNYCYVVQYTPTPGSGWDPATSGLYNDNLCTSVSGFSVWGTTIDVSTEPFGAISTGDSVKGTAMVRSTGSGPTGTVSFAVCGPLPTKAGCMSGGTAVGGPVTLSASKATSASFTPTAAGYWCFRATYSGNATFLGSSEGYENGCVPVNQSTTTTMAFDPPSITIGESTRPVATVTGSGGFSPPGTVAFRQGGLGGAVIETVNVVNSKATGTPVTPTAVGSYCQGASFAGANERVTNSGSSGCVQVKPRPSTATISVGSASIVYGATVGVRAQIVSTGTTTGNVSFAVCGPLTSASGCAAGGTAAGQAPLVNGAANLAGFKPGSAGVYCFRADYPGDATHGPATAGTSSGCVTVGKAATTTASTPSKTSIVRGDSVTTLATVASGAGTPTGSVQFAVCGPLQSAQACSSGGAALGTVTLDNGTARSSAFTPGNAGVYCFRAIYAGATSYNASAGSSTAACVTVAGAGTTTRLVPESSAIGYGAAIRANATVTSPIGTPVGTVRFALCGPVEPFRCATGGTDLGSSPLVNGVAAAPAFTPRAAGTYCFRAEYRAGSGYADSVDADRTPMCFDVRKATIRVDAAPATKVQGQPDPVPSWTLNPADFKLGDTATTSLITGSPACSISARPDEPGTYAGVVTCAPGLLSSANYAFTSGASADLTISAKPATGGETPTPTPTPTPGGSEPIVVGAPPVGGGNTVPPSPTPAATDAPAGTVTITSLKATKRGALTLKLRVSGPGRLDIVGRPAKGKRSISQRVTAKRAGTLTVTLTAKQVRRLVARGKRGTIKVSVTFTGTGGRPSTAGPRSVRVVGIAPRG